VREKESWTHTRHTGSGVGYLEKSKKVQPCESPKTKKRRVGLEAPIAQPERKEKRQVFWFYHFVAIFIVSVYTLYISWPYISGVGLPVFVDASGHAFKVWNLINCWSKYRVITYLWDSWWYEGYPFLQVYSPLSYLMAAFSGATFFGGDSTAGFRLTMGLSNILSAIFAYIAVYILYRSRMGGIIAGIVYASSAYRGVAVRTGMFPFYVSTMFLPLIIPLYHRCLSSAALRRYALSAFVMALLLLTHMQIFVYAILTLVLYAILEPFLKFHHEKIIDVLGKFVKNVKAFILTVLIGLCFAGFWLIPFLTYRSFFYTEYPEYYQKGYSIHNLWAFLVRIETIYLGFATLGLIILAFIVNKRTRKDPLMIFFSISGLLSAFLSAFQVYIFEGTLIEQMPFYGLITPARWVYITFLSLAFLAGGATKFICELLHRFDFLSRRNHMRQILKVLLTSIIIFVIILDISPVARELHKAPSIQTFPAIINDVSKSDEYYRIHLEGVGTPYVPAVSNREILWGWYIEGSPLRDWLYNLDWMTSYGERENMIPSLLELLAVKYYVVSTEDLNRIERFNKSGEFNISHKEDWCVMELKRDVRYLSARNSILYLGKEEDLITIAETLLFSSNSSILIHGWKEYVDDYTVEELSEFDAVLLHRYDCREQARTDDLLLQYASEGGVVLFAPFYAYSMLDMELYYAESEGEYEIIVNENFADTIFRDVNVTCFSPALYAEQYPWGYVALNVTSNKQETETLLTIDDNPVLATSTVGKGKIVWIGFNFLGHINQFLNKDEGRMIDNLVHWACGGVPAIELTMFEKRPYGYVDASFVVNEASSFFLLISESYYPGWRATIDQEPAKIYTAEPKLMAVKVEADANTLVSISLRYEPTEVHILGCTITILSVSLVAVTLLRPTAVKKIVTSLRARIKGRKRNQVYYQRF